MDQLTPAPGHPAGASGDELKVQAPQGVPPVPPKDKGAGILRSGRLWGIVSGFIFVAAASGSVGYMIGHGAAKEEDAAASSAAAAASAAAKDARLSEASEACTGRDTANTVELGDDGNSIIIDTRSKYTSLAGVACILGELGTPESITSSIDHTTAMMGSRNAESDGLSYSWSYHPDNGLNLVITTEG